MEWILTISLVLLVLYLLSAARRAEELYQQEKLEQYIEEARLRHLDELYGRTSEESSSNKAE